MHDQFVVATIGESNGDVAFICKHFYIEVLIKELWIGPDEMLSKSNTYGMHDVNDNLPINLGKKFKLQVSQDNKVLPSI